MKRVLTVFGLILGLIAAGVAIGLMVPWRMPPAPSRALVAHRGVHQTFPLGNIGRQQCTATLIYPPVHDYIENTLPSMKAAFDAGATMVELDLHRTSDGKLAVFHDWTLECRTNGKGVTNQQTLAYLKTLDLGYGYSADGGMSFPLRGKGLRMLPELEEVLNAFPDKSFAFDNKDGGEQTVKLLGELLRKRPAEQRRRLYYDGTIEEFALLQEEAPEVQKYMYDRKDIMACLPSYLGMLLTGQLDGPCSVSIIAFPYSLLGRIPGWPHLILAKAHTAGLKVYVSDVDSETELGKVRDLPLDGIVTNRIEVIGPLLATPQN
ncbi:MAG: glycerophosphodiester phosphodiesterase family protein [Candidatus Sericytochromatia bacterium]